MRRESQLGLISLGWGPLSDSSLGFTLAELLIALAILGVIATFAIPKVLLSQANQKRNAVLKEVIGMLSDIEYQGWITKQVTTSTQFQSWYFSKINAVKLCNSNSLSEGCWTSAQGDPAPSARNEPGVILANGAYVVGMDSDPGDDDGAGHVSNTILIDWNGPDGPNLTGQDQLSVYVCYGTQDCPYLQPSGNIKAGTLGPARVFVDDPAANQTLYNSLFN
jgi:prepilin-type N-terminal cleavage/methylation domain-containing protein